MFRLRSKWQTLEDQNYLSSWYLQRCFVYFLSIDPSLLLHWILVYRTGIVSLGNTVHFLWWHRNSYLQGKQAFLLALQKPQKWENGGYKNLILKVFIFYHLSYISLETIQYFWSCRKYITRKKQIISMITLMHSPSFLAFPSFPQGKAISPSYFFSIDLLGFQSL